MIEAKLTTAVDPTGHIDHLAPVDIVRDPSMSTEAKRALLASWASDARAVPDRPAIRRLDDGRLVLIDDVLNALKLLDGQRAPDAGLQEQVPPFRRGHWSRLARQWRRKRDDDDDDDSPPTPASMPPLHPVSGGGLAVVA